MPAHMTVKPKAGRNYKNGRAAEYAARDVLIAEGYTVMRAAGSKGAADLVGVRVMAQCWMNSNGLASYAASSTIKFGDHCDVLWVSVKRGTGRADKTQRERLAALPGRSEVWTRVRGGFEREVIK